MTGMSGIRLPGIKAQHAIVTPTCRANKGSGAMEEAINLLRMEYLGLVSHPANTEANFHFILMVDRPPPKPKPVDRSDTTMTDGSPATDDHRDTKENGQQRGYVVLSEAERAKGYVRSVRVSYLHAGPQGPQYPLRDLTDKDEAFLGGHGYVKFEEYPEDRAPLTGKFWTQDKLDAVGKGCKKLTTMSLAIAETYARDPGFYQGTFCSTCAEHLPVTEFTWAPPPGITEHLVGCASYLALDGESSPCDCPFAQVVGS